jgi:hypothetical protein
MADNKVGMAIGLATAALLLLSHKGEAATGYICPYCGEDFTTLAELQNHVTTVHPGQRIPIEIVWQ